MVSNRPPFRKIARLQVKVCGAAARTPACGPRNTAPERYPGIRDDKVVARLLGGRGSQCLLPSLHTPHNRECKLTSSFDPHRRPT
jgi:hypothetical protein